jgi:hypothetical protein
MLQIIVSYNPAAFGAVLSIAGTAKRPRAPQELLRKLIKNVQNKRSFDWGFNKNAHREPPLEGQIEISAVRISLKISM